MFGFCRIKKYLMENQWITNTIINEHAYKQREFCYHNCHILLVLLYF